MAFMRGGVWLAAVLMTAAIASCSAPATADITQADREAARVRMAQGRTMRQHHDLVGALASFQAADNLMGFPTTALEVARSQVDLGRLLEARATVRRILDSPIAPDEPAPFRAARVEAGRLAAHLDVRIPTLHLVIADRAGRPPLRVALDGVELAATEVALPLRVNPGHHVVSTVTSDGAAETAVDVVEQETKEVTLRTAEPVAPPPPPAPVVPIPVEAPPSPPAPPALPPVPPRVLAPPEAPPPPSSSRDWTLVGVGLGTAAVGGATGGVAGILSLSATHAAERGGCVAGQCPPPTHQDLNQAHAYATVSDVAFVVALAGLGLAVYGYLHEGSPATPDGAAKTSATWLLPAWVSGQF